MRVYISVDMEGVAGVSHGRPTMRGDERYMQSVALMDGEANAAITGAFDGGATEVVVNDSHGAMYNLTPESIDPRARLVQGKKPLSMLEASGDGHYDVALFVGYHARAGHPTGVISHTYNPRAVLVTVNGRPANEAAINALYLGQLGVPVGMVTGDDALAEETHDWLPWAEAVVVKKAISYQVADSLHPTKARDLIAAGAKRALAKAKDMQPLVVEQPLKLKIEYTTPGQADFAALVPGFSRSGDRDVNFTASDPIMLFRGFISAIRVAQTADE